MNEDNFCHRDLPHLTIQKPSYWNILPQGWIGQMLVVYDKSQYKIYENITKL